MPYRFGNSLVRRLSSYRMRSPTEQPVVCRRADDLMYGSERNVKDWFVVIAEMQLEADIREP